MAAGSIHTIPRGVAAPFGSLGVSLPALIDVIICSSARLIFSCQATMAIEDSFGKLGRFLSRVVNVGQKLIPKDLGQSRGGESR